MIDNLVILGAGNAGLISALMLKTAFPNLSISVIKSGKISTIGVGEGSNEHWLEFSKVVGISTADVLRETDATFKHGIKFVNWHGDDNVYYHSLSEYLSVQDHYTGLPYTLMRLVSENTPPEKLVWAACLDGKVPSDLDFDFAQFHFNTFKLNSFLEKLCSQRNITIVDDTILDVNIDATGNVSSLIGEKSIYISDFFIDTSGFNRVISKHLDSRWVSYQRYLPTNSAIAFPCAISDAQTPTFTEAKARKHGWSWKSPVYGRYGNGYVYSDLFCDKDLAQFEMQTEYESKIEIAKEIKFDPGKIDKFWIKNCVSVGLSGSFIEPLEASNIGTTIKQIKALMSSLVCWFPGDEFISTKYNYIFDQVSENILDFVQLHYLTRRQDTEFWRWCKYEMPLTDFNKETLEYFKKNFVSYNFFHRNIYELFDELDWIQVMHGLGMFDIASINKKFMKFPYLNQLSIAQCNSVVDGYSGNFLDHDKMLALIRENND